jgi:hypothetical protein
MPIHDSIRRCIHIKVNGDQCGSPAVTNAPYCYFHAEVKQKRREFKLPPIENSADVKRAITEVIRAIIEGTLDRSRASQILYGLQLTLNCLSVNRMVTLRQENDTSVVQALLDQVQPVLEYEKDLEAMEKEATTEVEAEAAARLERKREDANKSIFELDYYRKPTQEEDKEIDRRVMELSGNKNRD